MGVNEPEPLVHLEGNRVRWRGRELIYFAGCDYFRLSRHPAVLRAASDGLRRAGFNMAASRLTTGNHQVYAELEAALAGFFGAESALLLPTGYLTSTVAAQALAGSFDHVLLDAQAHPALKDAALHLGCRVQTFEHRSPGHLKRLVDKYGTNARLLVMTDGMFASDGAVAPLREYLRVLPASARLLVDDAHGAGVLGANGRGTVEHEGIARRRVIQCVTLSKAFGVYGGAVLASRALRKRMVESSRAFVGCTPLPPHLAQATLKAVQLLRRNPHWRRRLHRHAAHVRKGLARAGVHQPAEPGPIITWPAKSAAEQNSARQRLLWSGVFPSFLRYPGAGDGMFRFVISSEHTREQLNSLIAALAGLSRSTPSPHSSETISKSRRSANIAP